MKKKQMIALALGAVMLLSACSSGGSTGSSSAGASAADSTATAASTTEAAATTASSASSAASTQAAASSDDKPVNLRITWWGGDARHQATLDAIDLYEQQHPNVKIDAEYQSWDGYNEKRLTELAGGNQPDIMQVQATMCAEWQNSFKDSFANLSDQTTFDTSMFDSSMMENFCHGNDGNIYAVPAGVNSYNFMVNKTVTNAAGVELPENMTWDQFMDYGKKIHETNPDWYMLSMNDDATNLLMTAYIRQLCGQWYINEDGSVITDKDALTKAFTFLQEMIKDGIMEPMDTEFTYNDNPDMNPKFLNNEIACKYTPSATITSLDTSAWTDGYDVVNIPIMDNAVKTGVRTLPSQIWMVSNNENTQAALEFMQWMFTDKDAIDTLKDVRGVPPCQSVRDQLSNENLLDPTISKAVNIAMKVTDTPVPPKNENSQVNDYLHPLMQQLCYLSITPEDAAQDLIDNITEIASSLE